MLALLDAGTELVVAEEVADDVDEDDETGGGKTDDEDEDEDAGGGNCAVDDETMIEMADRSLALPLVL